jgi:hypothetical protein
MASFPLYDVLFATVQSQTCSEFKSTEKNKLIKCIQSLDQDGKDKVYALIRYYEIQHLNPLSNSSNSMDSVIVQNITLDSLESLELESKDLLNPLDSKDSKISFEDEKTLNNITLLDNNNNIRNTTTHSTHSNPLVNSSYPPNIPFGGNYIQNELVFDLDQLPLDLQYILLEFTKIHTQHMQDNQKIEKIRKKTKSENKAG